MITKQKRHLRKTFAIPLVVITCLSGIYCVGSEDTTICMISFVMFICGTWILGSQAND